MNESSTAEPTAASPTSRISPDDATMAITIRVSKHVTVDPLKWQSMLEKVANRISDEVFEAGGAISIGECARPWCTEMNLDGEDGEHARHHAGKPVQLGDADTAPEGPWWGYLLQEPGDLGFNTVKVVMSNDGSHDFEIPAWQLTVLRGLLERGSDSRKAIATLLRAAADDGTGLGGQ